MLSWMNRQPNKSQQELEYDKLTAAYLKKFGKPWAEKWGFGVSMAETLEKIRKCLADSQEQTLEEYKDGVVY